MREKNIQTIFGAWVQEHKHEIPATTVWELKLEKGISFAFGRVADHQVKKLLESKYEGMYYKISDTPVSWGGRMRFTSEKPFDCELVKGAEAYVAVCFYKPRRPKELIWIDIDEFLKAKEAWPRKSMREADVRKIASRVVVI